MKIQGLRGGGRHDRGGDLAPWPRAALRDQFKVDDRQIERQRGMPKPGRNPGIDASGRAECEHFAKSSKLTFRRLWFGVRKQFGDEFARAVYDQIP